MPKIDFTDDALEDLAFWKKKSPVILKRILRLIAECSEHPQSGIGKPEPLKYEFSGCWSRRIDAEHRIVYRHDGEKLTVLQLRYHYKK